MEELKKRLSRCDICPRNCKVNRFDGELGYCGIRDKAVVHCAFLHRGEEPAISGDRGSGTIFFSGCNLKCSYCQNYKFSWKPEGKPLSSKDLAKVMLDLQIKGAININLVTPTHLMPLILEALLTALKEGLKLPIVYNTSGYEKEEIIKGLDGIIDIYLSDMKYLNSTIAEKYSRAANYPLMCIQSLKEMYRQKKLPLWKNGFLSSGLIIRHLVLPGQIEDSKEILSWIEENTPQALLSLMFQYQPYYKAKDFPEINRAIDNEEYSRTSKYAQKLNLKGWVQEFSSNKSMAGPYFEPNIHI
ncbi:MAG: radical SAM protein [Candidatus Omnitrophica bacterium]|nr:radical SAM protein [Candidatus Omnitrophota bacterium]MBD3269555.1 radical SAM protein [Candidatus Omnitrophota bacterium]